MESVMVLRKVAFLVSLSLFIAWMCISSVLSAQALTPAQREAQQTLYEVMSNHLIYSSLNTSKAN